MALLRHLCGLQRRHGNEGLCHARREDFIMSAEGFLAVSALLILVAALWGDDL